ncbi:hypothetical protein KJ562_03275 [Patescibacteria group bacterium]|nr:hypothetical protein [Patescibacteria group bacterium]MBU4162102.1 hypothetical protein [Patescibacteria group bacterium]
MTARIKKFPVKINLKFIWGLSIFSIIGLIAVWVLQMQSLSQNYAMISGIQDKLAGLPKADSSSSLLASVQEIPELDKIAQNLDFEKIDKVLYIRSAGSTALAK